MKRSALVGFVLILAGIFLGVSFLNGASAHSVFGSVTQPIVSWFTKEVHLEKEYSALEIAELQKLIVHTGSTNVKMVRSDSEEVRLRLDGKVSPKFSDHIDLKTKTVGNQLEVEVDVSKRFSFGLNILNVTLTVELPEKHWDLVDVKLGSGNIATTNITGNIVKMKTGSGNIKVDRLETHTIDIHASSGNIKGSQFNAEQTTVRTGSGNIQITGYEGTSLQVMTSSGNVNLNEIVTGTLDMRLRSGNLRTEDFQADTVTFDLSSGDVKLLRGEGTIKGATSSGSIRVEVDSLHHDMNLRTGSGNVTVRSAHQPESLSVDYQGGSGRGKVRWDDFKVTQNSNNGKSLRGQFGSGEAQLQVRTGSGNFTLD